MTEFLTKISETRRPAKVPGVKETSQEKTARIPIKIVPQPAMRKPEWIRMKVPDGERFQEIKKDNLGKRFKKYIYLSIAAFITTLVWKLFA